MKWFVAVGFVALLVLSGCIGGQQGVNESYTSTYSYGVSIQPTANLTNASFLVPVPTQNNETVVVDHLLKEHPGRNASLPGNQSGRPAWNLSLERTRYGPMLRLHADKLPAIHVKGQPIDEGDDPLPGNDSTPRPMDYSVSASVEVNRSIDTREALLTEPTLQPKFNVTRVDCTPPREDGVECYRYEGRIYARYDASEGTDVDVGVSMYGDNSWFNLGWTGNTYHDFANAVTENGTGWVETRGEFAQGEGNYLENPPH